MALRFARHILRPTDAGGEICFRVRAELPQQNTNVVMALRPRRDRVKVGSDLGFFCVSRFLKQYEQIRKPGVHLMGHLAKPVQLFKDMEMMGATVKTAIG